MLESKYEREDVKRDIDNIVEQIREQCRILGGELKTLNEDDFYKSLACVFPETISITRVNVDEDESGKSSIYIESDIGWNGTKVEADGFGVVASVERMKGDAIFDTTTTRILTRKGRFLKVYKFAAMKSKKSRFLKKTDKIEYTITPSTIFVKI